MLKEKCPYFGVCGGCVWQDLSLQEYIQKKENFILRAFQDVGLEIHLNPMILIPTGTRRRCSFSFVKGHLGFNKAQSHQIVEIQSCPLLKPSLNKILPFIRGVISKLKTSGDVFLLDTFAGVDIHIKDNAGKPDLEKVEILTSLNQHPEIARLIYNNIPLFEKGLYNDSGADNFAQPSLEGEQTLVRLVVGASQNAHRAVDLFCGSGTFTKPLINKGISTTGYECMKEAVAWLGPHGVVRDLFRKPLTKEELTGVDFIVIDPPRAGALAQSKELAQLEKGKIVMVSCSPKTAARDICLLIKGGWHLASLTPVDQFTYSNHIELVAILEKGI